MKTLLLFSALILSASGCRQEPTVQRQTFDPPLLIKNDKDNTSDFKNPAYGFYGSSFLKLFAMLKQTQPGNLDTLLYFTSQKSIRQHGRANIIHLYENTNINFTKSLKALRRINDTLYILNYTSWIISTSTIRTITVSVEQDTCRLLLPNNLKDFLK